MQLKSLFVVLFATMLLGCQPTDQVASFNVSTMAFPQGHPDTGRTVFVEMGCTSCHEVAWETNLPQPTATITGPILDDRLSGRSPGYLTTSIVAPSYHVSPPYRDRVAGGLSPMADYSKTVTIRELVDLVAYLRQQGGETLPSAQVPIDREMFPHHL